VPETINSTLVDEKNTIHNTAPWLWLFELNVDGTQSVRVVGHDADVTYDGYTYSAFPVRVGTQTKDKAGTLPDIEITISNLSSEVAAFLELGTLLDQVVTIRLVHKDNLSYKVHEGEYTVKSATVTLDAVLLTCGQLNLMSAPFPAQRYFRGRCRWVYGGAGCQYDTGLPNAISGSNTDFDPTSCDLMLGQTGSGNGCIAHGDNEVANGLVRKHPLMFGGFPGIPKGPSRL